MEDATKRGDDRSGRKNSSVNTVCMVNDIGVE